MLPLSKPLADSLERLVQDNPLGEAGSAYLASRGLLEVATDPGSGLAFGEGREGRYAGRLLIPTLSARGSVVHLTGRCIRPHECDDHPKYLHHPGVDSRLYNTAALRRADDVVEITEGQLDAASLTACGLFAVGVSGAQAWKPHAWRLFAGFDRVRFWADRDDKGSSLELFARIRVRLPHVELVDLPDGGDVNSVLVAGGPAAVLALTQSDPDSNTGIRTTGTSDNTEENDDDPILHYDDEGNLIPF